MAGLGALVLVLVLGVLAAAIVGTVIYVADAGAFNTLNANPVVQNLPQSQQSTLSTLEAHGGAAISMDPGILLEAAGAVLVSLGVFVSYLFLKSR